MRVTKHMLENRLQRINRRLGRSYGLCNAPHYGGWELTSNKGSTKIYGRVPAKEMFTYLDGLINGIDMMEGAYKCK
jgi:hypothetical protein